MHTTSSVSERGLFGFGKPKSGDPDHFNGIKDKEIEEIMIWKHAMFVEISVYANA